MKKGSTFVALVSIISIMAVGALTITISYGINLLYAIEWFEGLAGALIFFSATLALIDRVITFVRVRVQK